MTTEEIVQYYAGLLILQYRNKPRASAHVSALVQEAIVDQLPLTLQEAFNLGTAIGVQLDTLAKYAGVTRANYAFSGQVILSDSDLLFLIRIKVFENNSGSSLADIQLILNAFFQGTLFVFDHQNMRLDYYLSSVSASVVLAQVLIDQNLLPKPMGVRIGTVIYAADLTHFFGFRTYYAPIANMVGFNSYSSYPSGTHWLSYQNAIT